MLHRIHARVALNMSPTVPIAATLEERIDALLPQTQCTRCGYPTCRAYAEAIAANRADIDRCPPGGGDGVAALAHLLGRAPKPLNPANGREEAPTMALIDEAVCIGCTKCIQACPVDAIVGAAKRMHTVIAAECTGCGLCLPPCPVDCIALLPIAEHPLDRARVLERAAHARRRFEARRMRLARKASHRRGKPGRDDAAERDAPTAAADAITGSGERPARPISRSAVLEAIARGKAKRAGVAKDPPTS
jgi:electron transport complex protein RnfB